MFLKVKPNNIEDYNRKISERTPQGVYFVRIAGYDDSLLEFFKNLDSFLLSSPIGNPNHDEITALLRKVGNEVRINQAWLAFTLDIWFSDFSKEQLQILSTALFEILSELKQTGLSPDMLKNAFIKFLIWTQNRLGSVIKKLGKDSLPKIVYSGNITKYELYFLSFLSKAGADILLINYSEDNYKRIDATAKFSDLLTYPKEGEIPIHFAGAKSSPETDKITISIPTRESSDNTPINPANPSVPGRNIRHIPTRERQRAKQTEAVTPTTPVQPVINAKGNAISISTNTWNIQNYLDGSSQNNKQRGGDEAKFFNYFIYTQGVDKETDYTNRLFTWHQKLNQGNRKVILVNSEIPNPTYEETQKIRMPNSQLRHETIIMLSETILFSKNPKLNTYIKTIFIEELSGYTTLNMSQLKNVGIQLLCWFNRYLVGAFDAIRLEIIPVFIFFGEFSQRETRFFDFLSKLPIDVFLFCPNPTTDLGAYLKYAFMITYEGYASIEQFPSKDRQIAIYTAANEAEQDLTDILYTGTGIYKQNQFQDSRSVVLKTTYEEINILWKLEAKFRPGFEEFKNRVMVPTIFAKISGVKDQHLGSYYHDIRTNITDNTILITKSPYLPTVDYICMQAYDKSCVRGQLDTTLLRQHQAYQYDYLDKPLQDYLLSKLVELIRSACIIGDNNIEQKITAVFLRLDKTTIRLIQKYDFTKEIPKVIMVLSTEKMCTIEDCIYIAFLSLVGFDILLYTPTGYQNLGKYFSTELMTNHIIGDYMFDLQIPPLEKINNQPEKQNILDRVFRKGRM